MAVKISIVSLIYQSSTLADWVYESIQEFTPLVRRGEAEFFFVANDPTVGLVKHLESKGYPYFLNLNEHVDDETLFALGYAEPEHMSRVYRGYNEGIRRARGDYVVLVNSDNYFSPDWLENLLKYSDRRKVVSSTLVERSHPTFDVFPGAVRADFGGSVEEFDKEAFLGFAATCRKTGLRPGGAYMPTLFHRDIAIEAGMYPHGNLAGESFSEVVRYGDEAFFDVLSSLDVEHVTALDSIVYHLKEGEREDASLSDPGGAELAAAAEGALLTAAARYAAAPAIKPVYDAMYPSARHERLMAGLLGAPLGRPSLGMRAKLRLSSALSPTLERLGLLKFVQSALARVRRLRGR